MTNRDEEIIELFKSGTTINGLSEIYGVSKQRIHQILKRDGVSSAEGGRTVRTGRKTAANYLEKEAGYLKKYGCTLSQYEEIVSMRKAMQSAGKTWQTTPLAAYYGQKSSAKYRGVPFKLTMWEWWRIWQDSGHWEERGLGMCGYVMCRYGDEGAYEVGNVFIDKSVNNVASAKRVARDLPMGVSARVRKDHTVVYAALRSINGKLTYLGTFVTPEAAHCAYLQAVS